MSSVTAVAEPGHVCLVSCPGSGKTRVIVAKLLYCIELVRDTTRRIACITHANAGADEIDSRLRETCFGGEDLYYEVATIHGFALQNILRPFYHLLPELRNGFTILASDADAYSEKAKELIRQYDLGAFAYDEFEWIQRGPDGNPSQVGILPASLQHEWCAWLDENAYVTLNGIVYHAGRVVQFLPSYRQRTRKPVRLDSCGRVPGLISWTNPDPERDSQIRPHNVLLRRRSEPVHLSLCGGVA